MGDTAAKKGPEGTSDYANAETLLLASILRGDQQVANRASLGPRIPIQLFQALRLIALGTSMEEMLGGGSRALVYRSGQRLGMTLGGALAPQAGSDLQRYLELVSGVAQQLSIGLVIAEKVDLTEGRLILRVDECVSCAGITNASAPICHFEAGMVGGLVRVFAGKETRAVETRCNAVGDKTCGIEVKLLA
jgi:predicted hydrocarbon binding protein